MQFGFASEGSTIHQAGRDLYVGAPPTGPGLGSVAVPDQPDHTVHGREFLLNMIQRLPGNIVVLHGAGGHGKTTVALSFAQRMLPTGIEIWWVDATSRESVSQGLLEVALRAGAPRSEVDAAWSNRRSAPDLLWTRLANLRKPWLLILDNADDAEVLSPGGRGWIRTPPSRAMVLVTSRDGRVRSWGRAKLVGVPPLPTPDGVAVLMELAPNAGDREDAAALAERLGGLPLGLRVAGKYLADSTPRLGATPQVTTFREYLRAMDRDFTGVASDVEDDRRSLLRTWELSLDLIADRGRPRARNLLRLLSTLAPYPIPLAILDPDRLAASDLFSGLTARDLDRLVADLIQYALVGHQNGEVDVLTLHPLIRETNLSQPDFVHHQATYRAVHLSLLYDAVDALNFEDTSHWPLLKALLPHCVQLRPADAPASERLTLAEIIYAAADFCDEIGLLSQAGSLYDAALPVYEETWGPDDERTLTARHNRAVNLRNRALYGQAEAELRKIYAAELRMFGPEDSRTLVTRRSIAQTLRKAGRLIPAAVEYRQVLSIRSRVLGMEDPSTLLSRLDLAGTLADQGSHKRALREYAQILGIRRRTLGDDHRATLSIRHLMAVITAKDGDLDTSERQLREVLKARERVLGKEHLDTLRTAHHLMRVLRLQGELEVAATGLRAVLRARERLLGSDHPDTKQTRNELDRAESLLGSG